MKLVLGSEIGVGTVVPPSFKTIYKIKFDPGPFTVALVTEKMSPGSNEFKVTEIVFSFVAPTSVGSPL